jgi:periplasmic protein CpxP/Spy
MEKNRLLTLVIVLLLILNFGTLAFLFIGQKNRRNGPHHPMENEGPANFIIEELAFDEQQKNAFEELKKEHQGQMRAMMESIKVQHGLMPDLIIAGDQAKADSVATQIGTYQKQIELYTYTHFVKVFALCKEEQRPKFKSIIKEILERMAPKKGMPPPR